MSYQELLSQEPKRCVNFELQPHLVGDLLELRPLRPEDWESLFAVASDPMIWEQHPAHDRYQEEVFKEFFREALESGGAFVLIDRKTGEIIRDRLNCKASLPNPDPDFAEPRTARLPHRDYLAPVRSCRD